jgi:DNA polymerase delta subunit 1
VQYLKVHTVTPNVVSPLRHFFEREERINGINLPSKTFESNIPFALRFMVDKKLTGMGWMRIPAGHYTVREHLKDSSCQVEIECSESAIMEVKN